MAKTVEQRIVLDNEHCKDIFNKDNKCRSYVTNQYALCV
jgi:hypothetical protein